MTSLFLFSVLGAELQRAHPYSPTRVTLHLLPPLPASATLHSHRQQHPAHHKCVQVSPACPSLHGLPGGTQRTHSLSGREHPLYVELIDLHQSGTEQRAN